MRLILVMFIGNIIMTTWSEINIVKRYKIDSSKGAFSHMILDEKTGNIYAGAMNHLYQLSSNLKLIKSVTTGPKEDNHPNCQPEYNNASFDQPNKPKNAYNKALVIDYKNKKLIACSSLYHGICQRYNLSDIGSKYPDICVPVVANDATSATIVFIAPGPTDSVSQPDVLYVAASRINDGQSAFRDLFPAIASRKLETFELVHTNSSKCIQATLRDTFPVQYIYGFGSKNFSYFVTVQKQKVNTKSYISKLIRVCQADKNYYSYAEVQLNCKNNDTLYNLVQAAYVGKAGSNLATEMDISEDDDVLYVVCRIGNPNTALPGNYSALCVYPLRTVRAIFTENIWECFHGIGNTGPSHFISQAACMKTDNTINDDYCGIHKINTPIDGHKPIQTEAAITFNTTASAVAVSIENRNTIAFVATDKGHIIKVLITSKHKATSSEDITVEEGSKINTDMILYGRYMYVLTDRRIYKVQFQECKIYTLCSSCVKDEYCGWNLYTDTCCPLSECRGKLCRSVFELLDIPKGRQGRQFPIRNPVLVQISPNLGPKSGGTLVTLSGDYMNAGNTRTVWIGIYYCEVKRFNSTVIICVTSKASDTRKEKLYVQFDNQMVTSNIIYKYTTDPTITNIDPKEAIVSGGITIDVTGTQLNTIQEPKMVIWHGNTKKEGECKVKNATWMQCYSPQVNSKNGNCSTNSSMKELYSYGFILDNVQDVLNLTDKDKAKFGTFSIAPDPIFQTLTSDLYGTYEYKPNAYLIISATCLSGVSGRDVKVLIEKDLCREIVVAESHVKCKPPEDEPKSHQGRDSLEVIVRIGRNFSSTVGYLSYDKEVLLAQIIIGLIGAILLLVIIFCVVILVLKKRERNAQKKWQIQMYNLQSKVDGQREEDNNDTSGASAPVIDKSTLAVLKDARLIINSKRLRVGDIIGKGHFGYVLKGYITLPGEKGDFLVAIKTLHKKNLRDIDVDAFLREIIIMKEFHHPNVLRLLGICLGLNDIPIMVLPFMENGDLLSYIRDDTNIPTVKDLIHFGIGIAEGVAYLSNHKFVHRDLAARNCMLDIELNVKVADFGLSREIYEREYYTSDNKKTKLPIRWMAPESMEKGTYSSKSDVWSFGVVLWELMTRGVTPYPEVDNWDVLRYLQKGRRLPQPQNCPDKLYVIMQKCWLVDPQARPTISVLAREITDMLSVAEHDMQQGLLKINIHCTRFNQADSAKYHYAYDDTYLHPPTKTDPTGGANRGNDYIEVLDETNDVQIDPSVGAKGTNKNEPYHYAYGDNNLEPATKSEPVDGATNNYLD